MSIDPGYEVMANPPDRRGRPEAVRVFDAGLPPNPLPKASRRGRPDSVASVVARLGAALSERRAVAETEEEA